MTQHSYSSVLREFLAGRMIVAAFMGFASGLPLLITLTLLQAWLTEKGLSLKTIGLFALISLPYSFEFVAGPFIDRYTPPWLGRRRGWLFAVQLALTAAIIALGMTDPRGNLTLVAVCALLVAFFSALQDTVINAYRRESLTDDEQGLGASMYIWGYRIGMLVASGGGLILAQYVGFRLTFAIMGLLMLPGLLTTLFAPEPAVQSAPPPNLVTAIVGPFAEFFTQRRNAVLILLFVVFYPLGNALATFLTTTYYLHLGFSMEQIGAVVKLAGFWAVIVGGFIGGALILRIGQYRALMGFGILQLFSTASYAWLTYTGPSLPWLILMVGFENFTLGMSTAAFVGFMANLTSREFTATQYALLTSLMSVPRTFFSAGTGYMSDSLGWVGFFLVCSFLCVPGLLLLTRFRGWMSEPTIDTTAPAEQES